MQCFFDALVQARDGVILGFHTFHVLGVGKRFRVQHVHLGPQHDGMQVVGAARGTFIVLSL